MTFAPADAVDLLTSLLESTYNSIFRRIAEGSPYLDRASAELRRPLEEMLVANHRRAGELAALLESLNSPRVIHISRHREEPYLAYLSLKFLLPKLVEEKRLCLARYENAIANLSTFPALPPEVSALLESHREEQHKELAELEHAAAHARR